MYRFLICTRYGKHNKIVFHIMRDRNPADRDPFYNIMCTFRCQGTATIRSHILKYKRLQRKDTMARVKNYLTRLHKAAFPIFGGDSVMQLNLK